MPSALSFPGIYIEEIPSGVRTITGVSTSNTAFVDFFVRGPLNRPVRITSFADFERVFGGVQRDSEASYAIKQYYLNGGSVAYVVRVAGRDGGKAVLELTAGRPTRRDAQGHRRVEGEWANDAVQVAVVPTTGDRFNLFVREVAVQDGIVVRRTGGPRSSRSRPSTTSRWTRPRRTTSSPRSGTPSSSTPTTSTSAIHPPASPATLGGAAGESAWTPLDGGTGGAAPTASADLVGSEAAAARAVRARRHRAGDLQHPLPAGRGGDERGRQRQGRLRRGARRTASTSARSCSSTSPRASTRPPRWSRRLGATSTTDNHAAIYFPRLLHLRPAEQRPAAQRRAPAARWPGVYARTDATRGVWKAPAGTEARAAGRRPRGTASPTARTAGSTRSGINVLRNFPIYGRRLGRAHARRRRPAGQRVEVHPGPPHRAVHRGEPLPRPASGWSSSPTTSRCGRRSGSTSARSCTTCSARAPSRARTPREAYFVKCDKETTTQNDINLGIVNIVVGFAPLKPAEFVVIQIQQIAGQIQV